MSSRHHAARNASDFVQLLREFLDAYQQLGEVFEQVGSVEISSDESGIRFERLAGVVGDDDRAVLFRLKERSHGLFRSEGYSSLAVRREALFDLTVGALFHEAMKLRESLYEREVYSPRLASLREANEDDPDELFGEFERLLDKSGGRIDQIVAEVRILLAQTRDQFRRVLIERAGERGVTRCLVSRRRAVSEAFPEGFEGLMEAMHGDLATGLIEASHSLLDSAYFVEAGKTLREAARVAEDVRPEVGQLECYAEGMQAFLEGDYAGSITTLEGWVDSGGHVGEREFAKRAAACLGRVGRLVDNDTEGAEIVDAAKQLQLRLETASL